MQYFFFFLMIQSTLKDFFFSTKCNGILIMQF